MQEGALPYIINPIEQKTYTISHYYEGVFLRHLPQSTMKQKSNAKLCIKLLVS